MATPPDSASPGKDDEDEITEVQSIGWAAIDAALRPLYGKQKPLHFGTVLNYALGGQDPLDGVSIYRRDEPFPHWHYITYGFTELYEKETSDPDTNGFGFELTFRLLRGDEEEPPTWVIYLLQNLARYVFGTGNVFRPSQYLTYQRPITDEEETSLCALAFADDPELGDIESPLGEARFIQVLGITADEERAFQRWRGLKMLPLLAAHLPLLCTDLERASILEDPEVAAEVERGVAAEGSGCSRLYGYAMEWDAPECGALTVYLQSDQIGQLAVALPGRMDHGLSLTLVSEDMELAFVPADTCAWEVEDNLLKLSLSPNAVNQLVAGLRAQDPVFEMPAFPDLLFIIREPDEDSEAEGL